MHTAALQHRTSVIAHRGLHDHGWPHQNTLAAFAAAFDQGADAVELDVRRTRDGVLVVHHDPFTEFGQRIADTDFADLAALPGGDRIPTFEQAIDLVRRRGRRVMVELKEPGYELEVVGVATSRLPATRVQFLSFEPAIIAAIERVMPELSTGVVVPYVPSWLRDLGASWKHVLGVVPPGRSAALDAAEAGADFVLIHHLFASRRALDDAEAAGLDVIVSTLDTPRLLRRYLADPRVDGVLTNRADVAVQMRRQGSGK